MTIRKALLDVIEAELMPVIDASFAKPYPPELEDRPGKIAWRRETVRTDVAQKLHDLKRMTDEPV